MPKEILQKEPLAPAPPPAKEPITQGSLRLPRKRQPKGKSWTKTKGGIKVYL